MLERFYILAGYLGGLDRESRRPCLQLLVDTLRKDLAGVGFWPPKKCTEIQCSVGEALSKLREIELLHDPRKHD